MAAVTKAGLFAIRLARRASIVSEYARRTAALDRIELLRKRFTVVPHGVSKACSPLPIGAERQDIILAVPDIYAQKLQYLNRRDHAAAS